MFLLPTTKKTKPTSMNSVRQGPGWSRIQLRRYPINVPIDGDWTGVAQRRLSKCNPRGVSRRCSGLAWQTESSVTGEFFEPYSSTNQSRSSLFVHATIGLATLYLNRRWSTAYLDSNESTVIYCLVGLGNMAFLLNFWGTQTWQRCIVVFIRSLEFFSNSLKNLPFSCNFIKEKL